MEDIIKNFERQSDEIERAIALVKESRAFLQSDPIHRRLMEKPARNPLEPVRDKIIYMGAKGGLYYYNRNGNKTYLNASQKRRCLRGNLLNVARGCPPAIPNR